MAYIFGSIWDRFNRNALNNLSEEVEAVGKSIQDLVANGQLTPAQYATLIQTINSLISKGDVSVSDIDKNKGLFDESFFTDDVKRMWTGDAPVSAVPADGSVTTAKIADKSIAASKLRNNYNYKGVLTSTDLNLIVDSGVYLVSSGVTNTPEGISSGILTVGNTGNFVSQHITNVGSNGRTFSRVIMPNSQTFNPWIGLHNEPIGAESLEGYMLKDGVITSTKLSDNFNYRGALNQNDDLNSINKTGVYVISGASENIPEGVSSGVLVVETSGAFCIQKIYSLHGNMKDVYQRLTMPVSGIFNGWVKPLTTEDIDAINVDSPLSGKVIVQFGDSIFGNKRPPNDISTAVANRTGATVHNIGLGGSSMSTSMNYWDAASMYRLADAVATTDFALQDSMVSAYQNGNFPNMPAYFVGVINLLKSIDFNEVDIITIAHGTNDFTKGTTLDNPDDELDVSTYAGSLRYSLRTILKAYPHIKVMVISPFYRFYVESDAPYEFIDDSDTHEINGDKQTDFVDKADEVSKAEKVLYLDGYYNFGINKYNRHYYFDDLEGRGGTHHNNAGGRYIGRKIGAKLLSGF